MRDLTDQLKTRLRTWAYPLAAIVGDSAWKNLGATFEVKHPNREVELACKPRASGGEAWFDVGPLRLRRTQ